MSTSLSRIVLKYSTKHCLVNAFGSRLAVDKFSQSTTSQGSISWDFLIVIAIITIIIYCSSISDSTNSNNNNNSSRKIVEVLLYPQVPLALDQQNKWKE